MHILSILFYDIYGLVKKNHNSSVLAVELRLSCANLLISCAQVETYQFHIFQTSEKIQLGRLELFNEKGVLFQEEYYLPCFFRPLLTNKWYNYQWIALLHEYFPKLLAMKTHGTTTITSILPKCNIQSWTHLHAVVSGIMTCPQIARFMGPTWGLSGADRTQMDPHVGPMNFAIWVIDLTKHLCFQVSN